MKARWLALGLPVVAGVVLSLSTVGRAFDHRDGPQAHIDPATDVSDLYAFMRPEMLPDGGSARSSHMVLVATFEPGAAPGSSFPEVTYEFRVQSLKDTNDLSFSGVAAGPDFKVVCSFATGNKPNDAGPFQLVTCSVNGQAVAANIDEVKGSPTSPVRVFAGVRADPAFADLAAVEATVDAGQLRFTSPGTNAFEGRTVRALVVEFDVNFTLLGADAGPNTLADVAPLAVSVASVRR